jgi:hypothetical protein
VSNGRNLAGRSLRVPALALIVASLAAVPAPASAQGLLDMLFGRRSPPPPPSASAYVNPYPDYPRRGPGMVPGTPTDRAAPAPGGRSVYHCVRLCDGRHFPIQRHANASPAQLCSAFCPAARTKIYSGSSIEHAVSPDGMRYADLNTAFLYREKVVPDCTCNGRDAFGLVTLNASNDPTLRPGDIVATGEGLMAYTGAKNRGAEFTPVQNYPGLPADTRQKLSEVKVEPSNAAPLAPPAD